MSGYRWMPIDEGDNFALNEALRQIALSLEKTSVVGELGEGGWFDNLSTFNAAKVAGANGPSWDAFRGGIYAYTFSPTSMNEVWMSFHVNHDYMPGTPVYPHIHFVPFATGAGVVRWGVEYTVAKGHSQQAFPPTDTIYIEHTVADGSAYLHIVAEADEANAIPADNIEPDSLIQVRIFRDAAHANDTYASKVYALNADLHYQRDRVGTRNRAPDFYG